MVTLPRKIFPAPAQNLTGAMALVEASMPPHPKFPSILTLNMGIPTEMDWDELKVVPFTIKSCIFVLSSLLCQVCVCWTVQWIYVANLSLQIKQSNQAWLECAAVLMGKEGLSTPGGSRGLLKYPAESGSSRYWLSQRKLREIRVFALGLPAVTKKDGAFK